MQTYLCGIQDAIFLPAILSATKEKPPEINGFRGFVVDKRLEISNLVLVRDVANMIDFIESLSQE
jgi:hypothetical protein